MKQPFALQQILLTEDDRAIAENLLRFLEQEGFAVTWVKSRADCLRHLSQTHVDLLLLDVSLPDGNGFSLCGEIKALYAVPIIFLTASTDEFSVVAGLELGAEDYITKPFRPRELLSRIRNVLRRAASMDSVVEIGNLRIDYSRAAASKNGEELFLSALEYRILLVFLQNRGQVLSRSRLLEEIWDVGGEFVNDNTLSVYIRRLRAKIEDNPDQPRYIRTLRGNGYRLD